MAFVGVVFVSERREGRGRGCARVSDSSPKNISHLELRVGRGAGWAQVDDGRVVRFYCCVELSGGRRRRTRQRWRRRFRRHRFFESDFALANFHFFLSSKKNQSSFRSLSLSLPLPNELRMLQAAAILRLSSRRARSSHCAIESAKHALNRATVATMATVADSPTNAQPRPPPLPSFSASEPLRVLFCGRDMHFGWQYTHEALLNDRDIEVVQCDRESAARLLPEFHVAVPLMTRLDAAAVSAAGIRNQGNLRLVLQFGVGLEGVDLSAAARAGVAVSNIPSTAVPNALSCAEMSIFLALAALRRAPELAESIKNKRLGAPPGRTLWGKRALLIGFGGIGRALAPRLRALGVEVDAVRRSEWESNQGKETESDKKSGGDGNKSCVCPPAPPLPSSSPYSLPDYDVDSFVASSYISRKGQWSDLYSLASTADLAFVCCAENDETRNVVGDAFWERAKPGLILVNVARGGLAEPSAALRALKAGKAGALALDVQWEEPVDVLKDDFRKLCSHERVFLTPHVAGVTEESYRGMAEVVAGAARRLAREGEVPERVVNLPVAGLEESE